MDKQHRILLPQKLRDLVKLDLSKPYCLCLEDDKIYYLLEPSQLEGQVVLDVVSLDEKGRLILDSRIIRHYNIAEDAEEFIFAQKNKIYISFSE